MVTNRYLFDSLIRFRLAVEHPELLNKLDKQIEKENQECIKAIGKRLGVRIKFFGEPGRLVSSS